MATTPTTKREATDPPGDWRTDAEVRDEHDRLATIYRQRGLSVLIEIASDEIVKLRRASLELAEELRALVDLIDRDVAAHPCPGFSCAWCARPNTGSARAILARLEG